MNLFVIAGFLGSGKTTLLLSVAKAFSAAGKKLAIIENEVGDIGVDDAVISGEGLEVKEIYSGCICCSLRTDLTNALLEIEREYNPDLVILEPSGVASPKQVMNALLGYGGEIDRKHVAVIVDAERYHSVINAGIPIVIDGIKSADILVINKIDLADADEIEKIEAGVRDIRPGIRTIQVSGKENINIDELVNEFMIIPGNEKNADKVYFDLKHDKGPKATTCTHCFEIVADEKFDREVFVEKMSCALKCISLELETAGCGLIGHIKAVAKTSGGGYLMSSITSAVGKPSVKGRLPLCPEKIEIAVNAIVYGMDRDILENIVRKTFKY